MIAARYPTSSPSHTKASDPTVIIARKLINSVPIFTHHRNSSSTATTSCSLDSEKSLLLAITLKTAATNAVRSYGAIIQRKQEQRKAEMKRSISRPVAQESQWTFAEQKQVCQQKRQTKEQAVEGESSLGSVYSTRTWATETEDELERVGAFEFDIYCCGEELKEDRSSTQTFASSERSYTFF